MSRFGLRSVFEPANALTLVRLPLAASLWLRPWDGRWLLGIVAMAALSDVLDGRVARFLRRRATGAARDERDAIGAWLDPACDKIFSLSALGALWFGFQAPLGVIALTGAREIVIAPLLLLYLFVPGVRQALRFDFHADWLGKTTTVLQFAVGLSIVVAPRVMWPLAYLVGVVGVWSALRYVVRGIRAARSRRDQLDERMARRQRR